MVAPTPIQFRYDPAGVLTTAGTIMGQQAGAAAFNERQQRQMQAQLQSLQMQQQHRAERAAHTPTRPGVRRFGPMGAHIQQHMAPQQPGAAAPQPGVPPTDLQQHAAQPGGVMQVPPPPQPRDAMQPGMGIPPGMDPREFLQQQRQMEQHMQARQALGLTGAPEQHIPLGAPDPMMGVAVDERQPHGLITGEGRTAMAGVDVGTGRRGFWATDVLTPEQQEARDHLQAMIAGMQHGPEGREITDVERDIMDRHIRTLQEAEGRAPGFAFAGAAPGAGLTPAAGAKAAMVQQYADTLSPQDQRALLELAADEELDAASFLRQHLMPMAEQARERGQDDTLTAYQRFRAQRDHLRQRRRSVENRLQELEEQMNAARAGARRQVAGVPGGMPGGEPPEMGELTRLRSQARDELEEIRRAEAELVENVTDPDRGAPQQPANTAFNPRTGERLMLRDGQWVPIQ